jgi:predicted transcriptional regulator
MSQPLDDALEAAHNLPAPVTLSADERAAIAASKAAAARGEFATDEQVRAIWAKHGL